MWSNMALVNSSNTFLLVAYFFVPRYYIVLANSEQILPFYRQISVVLILHRLTAYLELEGVLLNMKQPVGCEMSSWLLGMV